MDSLIKLQIHLSEKEKYTHWADKNWKWETDKLVSAQRQVLKKKNFAEVL